MRGVKGESIVRLGGDWRGLLDAAYDDAPRTDAEWGTQLVEAAKAVFTTGTSLAVVEHPPDLHTARTTALVVEPRFRPIFNVTDNGMRVLGMENFRHYYYPRHLATTHGEIEREVAPSTRAATDAMRRSAGVTDALGLIVHPEPGVVLVLFAGHERTIHVDRRTRTLLTNIALHLETSYRLRRRGEEVVRAIVDPDGGIVFREGAAKNLPPDPVLATTARRAQRAKQRGKAAADAIEAVDLWPALVNGQLSLVERKVDGRSRYLFVENAPRAQPFRALAKSEIDVVSYAARGLSSKQIAYALGHSSSTISAHLASAAGRVGAASRIELVRLAAMLTRDPRARFADFKLSAAERDVLELLKRGLSNEEIASMRSRSIRTIANQVASLLRKTKTTSRRELVVQAAQAADRVLSPPPLTD